MCPSLAAKAATEASPSTVTGDDRYSVVPSPSCPEWLYPQQATRPSSTTAHACPSPKARKVAPVTPCTVAGVTRFEASPSRPQHWTPPPVRIAHV